MDYLYILKYLLYFLYNIYIYIYISLLKQHYSLPPEYRTNPNVTQNKQIIYRLPIVTQSRVCTNVNKQIITLMSYFFNNTSKAIQKRFADGPRGIKIVSNFGNFYFIQILIKRPE